MINCLKILILFATLASCGLDNNVIRNNFWLEYTQRKYAFYVNENNIMTLLHYNNENECFGFDDLDLLDMNQINIKITEEGYLFEDFEFGKSINYRIINFDNDTLILEDLNSNGHLLRFINKKTLKKCDGIDVKKTSL